MIKAKIVARVIPDGFQRDKSGNASSLRVSLALMPDFRDFPGGTEVDIENWPRRIWENRKNLKLFVSSNPNADFADANPPKEIAWYARGNITGNGNDPKDAPLSKEFNEGRADAANALWRRIFLGDCGDLAQFDNLMEALKEDQPKLLKMERNKGGAGNDAVSAIIGSPMSYPVATLAEGVEGLYGSQTAVMLLSAAGQLAFDGKREAWDLARPMVSPAFFDTVNSSMFGIFASDTLTNRLLNEKTESSRWYNTDSNDEVPEDVTGQVMLVGKTLEGPLTGTKATGVQNYISSSFVRHFGQQFAAETAYNLKVAQFTFELDAAIRKTQSGLKVTAVPDIASLTRRSEVGTLDHYFAQMAVDASPWTRGRFSEMPEEPGLSAKDRQDREEKARAQRAEGEATLQRAVAAYHAAWRPDTPVQSVDALSDACNKPVEIARRKFLSILSHPSLAKFLGFIIDVELKLGSLPYNSDQCFWMFADFGDGSEKDRRVTTATMLADKDGVNGFFGPCPKLHAAFAINVRIKGLAEDDAPLVYERGVFNLAAPGKDTQARFRLVDFDVDAAVQALENTGHSRTTAREKGELDSQIKVALPNLRSRGIALIDRDRSKEIVEEITIAEFKIDGGAIQLYAEDLVIGYRLDVGICGKNVAEVPPMKRWRTLTDRQVRYDPKDIKKEFSDWLQHDVDRENGFVKPITRTVSNEDPAKNNEIVEQYVPQETVAVWTGGSLAVGTGERPPAIAEQRKGETDEQLRKRIWELPNKYDQLFPVTEVDAYCELGANLGFELAKKPSEGGGIPPLRFGRRYWLGARLVYANGGSISLPTAAQLFYTRVPQNGKPGTTAVGGREAEEGFLYMRGERAGAPVVLLPPDDPLVVKQPSELRGEQAMTVILREVGARATRYLVPPRSTFDLAEAHGQFDQSYAQRPPGAFNQYHRILTSGEFPNARPNKDKKGGTNPGQVLKPGGSEDALPYYPDPLARECHVRVLQHDAPIDDSVECKTLHFYEKATDAVHKARPVRIKVRTLSPPAGQPLHKITLLDKENPPAVQLEIGPGADIDLLLWSGTDQENDLASLRPVASGLKILTQLQTGLKNQIKEDATSPAAHSKVAAALSNVVEFFQKPTTARVSELVAGKMPLVELFQQQCGPVPTITDQRRLRVVNPVKRPIDAPRVKEVSVKCEDDAVERAGVAALRAVRVKPLPEAEQSADHWAKYVAANVESPLCYPSEEDASQTFFVGTALVHRASTGKLRFEAVWREYKDDVTLKDGAFVHVPSSAGPAIFSVDKIVRDDGRAGLSDLSLIRDETGGLRGLKIDFPDTKARRVTFGLHGISRFTEFYKPAKPAADAKKGDPKPEDFEKRDSARDVTLWVPSTARPASPVVDRILPVFRWDIDPRKNKITFTRNVDLRVYLKRPWHSSGEGERLAVICWPPNLFSDATADEVARCTLLNRAAPNVINPKEEFLTRWGADPIHLSGDLSDLIPADQFVSAESRVANLPLQLRHRDADLPGGIPQLDIDKGCPNDPPDPAQPLKAQAADPDTVRVAIATYTPKLDAQRGDVWYSDLPITPGESYFPFIRLGLARYQPNSSETRLALSYPVAEWAQIPPQRKAIVEFVDKRKILVTVTGIGYHESQGDEIPDERHLMDRPRLRIRVCRAVKTDGIPSKGKDVDYMPLLVNGKPLEYPKLVPSLSGNTVTWLQEITLPQTSKQERYAVIVEETEVMVADGDVIGDVVTAERGPMFACTIPFRSPHNMGSILRDGSSDESFAQLAPADS
ncbi:hypothetical protein NKI95_20960 [Mesorhizobium sp. M0306]|uniref:hypothetical protein n=1 Tax=Mesorhizobium sp. M0306 TaxID=2956932 RepID=UPI00333CD535